MRYDRQRHHRHSIRLKGYDYSQAGAYFVTICTRGNMLFLENKVIRTIAEQCWLEIHDHFPPVELGEWVIMPNHLHGILVIVGSDRSDVTTLTSRRGVQLNAPTKSAISPCRNTLSVMIRTYKTVVTTLCRRAGYDNFGWQRNYYEHIICHEDELNYIRQYIVDNPIKWDIDENNPNR